MRQRQSRQRRAVAQPVPLSGNGAVSGLYSSRELDAAWTLTGAALAEDTRRLLSVCAPGASWGQARRCRAQARSRYQVLPSTHTYGARVSEPLHVQVALALGWRWYVHAPGANSAHPGMRYLAPPDHKTLLSGDFAEYASGDEPLAIYTMSGTDKTLETWQASVPHYDTDWSAGGPLLERFEITLHRARTDEIGWHWRAWPKEVDGGLPCPWQPADKPLTAVCNLIVSLHAAGKLPEG